MESKTCLNCKHWAQITYDVLSFGLCEKGDTIYSDGHSKPGMYTTYHDKCKCYEESIDTKNFIKENNDNL